MICKYNSCLTIIHFNEQKTKAIFHQKEYLFVNIDLNLNNFNCKWGFHLWRSISIPIVVVVAFVFVNGNPMGGREGGRILCVNVGKSIIFATESRISDMTTCPQNVRRASDSTIIIILKTLDVFNTLRVFVYLFFTYSSN